MRNYTDAELLALPPLVIEPGYTDETGTTRNRHLRNPFLPDGKLATDAAWAELANRWSTLNWYEPEDSTPAVAADGFDVLFDAIAAMDGTPLFFAPPECDGTAVHPLGISPKDAGAVAQWEQAALAMHSAQTTTLPEAKPAPQSLVRGRRAPQVIDDPIPNFADLPEAERRKLLEDSRRKLERGD